MISLPSINRSDYNSQLAYNNKVAIEYIESNFPDANEKIYPAIYSSFATGKKGQVIIHTDGENLSFNVQVNSNIGSSKVKPDDK